jgi:hypothetical protein
MHSVFECTYNIFVVYFNVPIIYFNAFVVCFNVFQCVWMYVTYSAIKGISHRYHHCGPICMLEVKGKCRGSSLQMAFRIFRCHRAFKPTRVRLTPRLGTSSLLSLHMDVWRLIFWSWVSHVMEWEGAHAPHCSIAYALPFFKNGANLTVYVITSVCICFYYFKRSF